MTQQNRTLREWAALWDAQQFPERKSVEGFGTFLCPECAGTKASYYRVNHVTWHRLKDMGVCLDPVPGAEGYFFVDRALLCDQCGHLIPESVGTVSAGRQFFQARMRWQTAYKRFEPDALDGFSPPIPVPMPSSAALLAAADKLIAECWEQTITETNKFRKALGSPPASRNYDEWISGKHDHESFGPFS